MQCKLYFRRFYKICFDIILIFAVSYQFRFSHQSSAARSYLGKRGSKLFSTNFLLTLPVQLGKIECKVVIKMDPSRTISGHNACDVILGTEYGKHFTCIINCIHRAIIQSPDSQLNHSKYPAPYTRQSSGLVVMMLYLSKLV